ncbi:MAG: sugar ABC transporter permease [Oligosphaeraceae bacterium]|nr:sugar ABC transporter permease [Oligosphaeraceae bacterium]
MQKASKATPGSAVPGGVVAALCFLLPALLVYALFVLLPIGQSLGNSFRYWESPLLPPQFCGWENYRLLLRDRVFWLALRNNAFLLFGSLLVQLPLAAGVALLLNYQRRGRTFLRTAFFTPMVMPTAAIAVLWQYLYEPRNGIFTYLVRLVEPEFTYAWLASPETSMIWIFVTICWQYIGFHTVLFLAGLAAIPETLYEAARLDGASEIRLNWHVILPNLKPTFAVSATLSVIGSLKYFDLVYLMGGGLPETSREVLATYVYRLAFEESQGRFGYGSAVAVSLFLLALLVVIPLQARRTAD